MKQLILVFAAAALAASCTTSKKSTAPVSKAVVKPADTTKPALGPMGSAPGLGKPAAAPKPYAEVITAKAQTQRGLFTIHKVDDKYYFEIGDSVLGKDLLTVNRISKAAAGMRMGTFGYAGDQVGQSVNRFERGPNNKVFIRTISFEEYAKDSTSPMYNTVMNSNIQPISAAFDIKAFSKDGKGVVIDVSDFVLGDNDVTGFSGFIKRALNIGQFQADKSYVQSIRSFPINVEIKSVRTFGRTPAPSIMGMPSGTGGGNITLEMNTSMVMLPANPMQSRYFDPRVGYFTVGYTDFDLDPQGVKRIEFVKRWRLEPKPGDMEKYMRGELVEPQKPIVFYIDPATPKKWVPYLIQGVNDWKSAFEKAGFKNAIVGKMAPTKAEDSTWSLDDARNSAIVYKPSDVPNASGPSISDPRTGEIMESHINWYHNVMSLLRNWYMIQTAATDKRARAMTFDDELMGQLIRFVSSHEVGHTLGLRHNFGSSSTVPVDSLRNKKWVEANGHTPSIMDYARFNYVAQPEDNISEAGLFPRIGDYDNWAIEWGYRLFPQFGSADAEKTKLNSWVIDKMKNKRLWFGTEMNPDDPRSQSEDLGDNSMKASEYGIKNLKRIVPELKNWTKTDNEDYENLDKMYGEIITQFGRYMGHVSKNVAGIYETPKMVEQTGAVYEYVSKAKQMEALNFLNEQLFKTPTWLIDKDILAKTGKTPLQIVSGLQDRVISRFISDRTFGKLTDGELINGAAALTGDQLMTTLRSYILTELAGGAGPDAYRRNLQKSFVNTMIEYITPKNSTQNLNISGMSVTLTTSSPWNDGRSIVRAHLGEIRTQSLAAANRMSGVNKFHFTDIADRIERALNPKL